MARPEPSPTSSRALYVVTALDGDDDAGGSSSKEFVRIPRNNARADTRGLAKVRSAADAIAAFLAAEDEDNR